MHKSLAERERESCVMRIQPEQAQARPSQATPAKQQRPNSNYENRPNTKSTQHHAEQPCLGLGQLRLWALLF